MDNGGFNIKASILNEASFVSSFNVIFNVWPCNALADAIFDMKKNKKFIRVNNTERSIKHANKLETKS